MKNRENKAPIGIYEVTVQRQRVVQETRTVQVIARSEYGAKMLAKQKRPGDGWIQESIKKSLSSAETTCFLDVAVKFLGEAKGLPDDSSERHRLLNDSAFVVRVAGEY